MSALPEHTLVIELPSAALQMPDLGCVTRFEFLRAVKDRAGEPLAGSGTALAQSSTTRSSSIASGLPIQQVAEPNTPALRLETEYTYETFGNKLSATVSGRRYRRAHVGLDL